MTILPRILSLRAIPVYGCLLVAGACAPAPSATTPAAAPAVPSAAASPPVLLSCPAGQQPLLRQVPVGNALVPQVECVTTPGTAMAPGLAAGPAPTPYAAPVAYAAPVPVAPAAVAWAPEPRPVPVPTRTVVRRPAARRVVYDDVMEIERPSRRSWQKSALIIGSAAGVGAGVGAATGGKKGALIGAAVGGGAATIWDQVTRRSPR